MADTLASTALCSVCGANLVGNTVCVACLLRAGLGDAEGASIHEAVSFGDFEIERREDGSLCELGRGAMGVTYRALDTILHRPVALKVIEPPASAPDSAAVRERFLREARAAAALRHPNVAAVFHFSSAPEVNRCYCAMELVEGETLEARVRREGPLPVELAIEVAIQVTRALIAAAERGLVHRDLKPGNIMLTHGHDDPARVEVKVIDFGLAKAAVTAAAAMELTHGDFVGTPAFASPEQFTGEAVDARSDIYALGVTLWFALTSRLPFTGGTIEEIRQNQGHSLPVEQLRRRALPRQVIDLLRSCLEPNPEKRPPSAQALMHELEACRPQPAPPALRARKLVLLAVAAAWVATAVTALVLLQSNRKPPSAPPPALQKGIAVLPFENLSTDPVDAFFTEGMQDDVLTSVGRLGELKVIARASVMDYRGPRDAGKIRQIGEALGVSHVLEGSVRRAGDRVVVRVALIDTRDQRQIWSERYERNLTDALSLQGELAVEIGHALRTRLTPAENTAAAVKPTQNADAYLAYLRAREAEIAYRFESAIQLYQQAIDLDPGFALAHARVSIAISIASEGGVDRRFVPKARAEAEKALRLQPGLGEARLALTYCYLWGDRDYVRALQELSRTAEVLPNSAEVPLTAAFIYKRLNRYRDRVAALLRAETLDPRNRQVVSLLAITLEWMRDWPEAMRTVDRLAVLRPREFPLLRFRRAISEFRLKSDINVLKSACTELGNGTTGTNPDWLNFARYATAMLERDYPAAAQLLAAIPPAFFSELGERNSHPKAMHEALLAVARGANAAETGEALERVRQALETLLPDQPAEHVSNRICNDLGVIHALMGRQEDAVRAVEQGRPGVTPDSIEANATSAALALIYARTGESEKALDLIEHLLTVPVELDVTTVYNMTLVDLKWRWVWDPLRSHPRFQKLLAGPEPKTVY